MSQTDLIQQITDELGDSDNFSFDRVWVNGQRRWVVTHLPSGQQADLRSRADWEMFQQGLLAPAGGSPRP